MERWHISVHSCGRADGVGAARLPFFCLAMLVYIFVECSAPHAESSLPRKMGQERWGLRLASGLPAKGMMTTISFLINRVEEFTWLGGAFGQCRQRCTRNWWIVWPVNYSPCTRERHTRSLHLQEACISCIINNWHHHAAGRGCSIARPQRPRDRIDLRRGL